VEIVAIVAAMLNILLLVGVFGDDLGSTTGIYETQLESEFTGDADNFQALEGLDESMVDRRLEHEDIGKNLAIETLKKMHSAQKMYKSYKEEKNRMERRAVANYIIGAVFVALFAGGTARYVFKVWKSGRLPEEDEEALMMDVQEEGLPAVKPPADERRTGPSTFNRVATPDDEDAPLTGAPMPTATIG
jgi:hypothetical protein